LCGIVRGVRTVVAKGTAVAHYGVLDARAAAEVVVDLGLCGTLTYPSLEQIEVLVSRRPSARATGTGALRTSAGNAEDHR